MVRWGGNEGWGAGGLQAGGFRLCPDLLQPSQNPLNHVNQATPLDARTLDTCNPLHTRKPSPTATPWPSNPAHLKKTWLLQHPLRHAPVQTRHRQRRCVCITRAPYLKLSRIDD